MYTLGIFHLFHGPLLVLAPFAFPELHLAYVNYFYFLMFLYTLTDRKCPITLLAKYHHCRQYGEPAPKYPEMAIFGWSESMSDIFFMTTTVGYIGSLLYVVLPMDDFRVSGIISCLYLVYPKGEPMFIMVEWGTRLFMVYQLTLSGKG
jgi:hypothetical protein